MSRVFIRTGGLAILLAAALASSAAFAQKESRGADKAKNADDVSVDKGRKPEARGDAEGKKEARGNEGLAMGKDKEQGDGLALGKDKEKGEGLALGKDKSDTDSATDSDSAVDEKAAKKAERAAKRQARLAEIKGEREKRAADETHQKKVKDAKAKNDPLANEERKHMRRMARLERLAQVATEAENSQLQQQVEELKTRELERHQKALTKLAEEKKARDGQGRDAK